MRTLLPNATLPLLACLGLVLAAPTHAAENTLELKKGDHICIIGNTLADRMQHDGWLEAYIQNRYPKHELVFRNLGFSGDELTIRLRSQSFGTPDQWLAGDAPVPEPNRLTTRIGVRENRFETTNTRADVVFAFFGYNESFAGKEGLEKFKKDLDATITGMLAKKYNGKSAPRIVIFSSIALENHHSPNLPDGKDVNERLEVYTSAMAEVCHKHSVVFVDIFHPTLALYRGLHKPYTINGIHLNREGYHQLAKIIDGALFAEKAPQRDAEAMEHLRQAVADKNFYWFSRYRIVDGYNVYGGRAFERYADKQSNYEDQQRELEILDVKTSNRDKVIWAAAQGMALKVDDSNCPPLIPVKTNKPGSGPGGAHVFLDGNEAIKKMTVGKKLKVTLFASEKEFPELSKPVQMQFDNQGRLWVAAWPSYPHWKPTEEPNDKLLIFEDTDGDGKADKVTVFADHLNCPTGFEFYNGGVLLAQAPDLIFLKDTKGTGKADVRQRVLHGLDSADTHHTANSFVLDPGGALYFQEGVFHRTQVETPYAPTKRCADAGVYRYEPRSQKFDVYVSYGFANPHGHVFDRWGQDIVVDGTGANPYHAALFSGHLDFPNKHPHPPQVYQQRTRPCPGMEYLSSKHFPDEYQGNLLVGNVIGFQGILRYRIDDKDSSLAGTELEPMLYSSDPNFRPSDLKIGPDGALWFIDWQNPIIGHLQHALRDPSRDREHGRIYRVTYEGRQLDAPTKIAGEPIDRLLSLLTVSEDRVRYRVRIELGARKTEEVIPAVNKWLASLNPKDADHEHDVLEALWVHQHHNVVNVTLLKQVLASPDFHARAAATRVLCYWRDRVPEALDLLKKQAADSHPRVRLEAVRAASFFTAPEAVEIPVISAEYPSDIYLDYVRAETMKALEPYWKKAIADGKTINFTSDAGARYFLKNVTTDELLKMKASRAVDLETLFRKGIRDENRRAALADLAKSEKKSELRVLLDAIQNQDEPRTNQDESVTFDLVRLLTSRNAGELAGSREELEKMATRAKQPVNRQLGYVALIAADGSIDKAWALGTKSIGSLRDLVDAMPLIRDPGVRASLYPKVEPLLRELPKELQTPNSGKATLGRYVRIELSGKKTLTLAEVEVYSDGRNVARQGKATQKNTAYNGDANKAIDGNKSGSFGSGGQTHTQENTQDPWWEIDLGQEFPISSVVIYNRTDDGLGKRLDGFTLKVLDQARNVVVQKSKQPAPAEKVAYEVGSESPERIVRRSAMLALTTVRGKETPTFKALASFLASNDDRHAAIQAMQRIPVAEWPKEDAKPLLDTLMAYIRKVPTAERTSPAVLDALQLGDTLASLLPRDQALNIRKELGELGVRVLRVGTVTDQMLYDKERLVVKAGKPVEILFENTDLMPHNLVIAKPGSLEEIGQLGEAQATQPGALERHYVPNSTKILLSSRLLPPRNSEKLSWTAPKEPGVYPYVCTYPGHWRRMYGSLYVVEDLEEYLADAEGYLARHPLPIKDELLKFNRPRKEWKFEELVSSIEKLEGGRSFSNGKQLFQVANCVACHKLNGVGQEFGPDLAKLDPKLKPTDILKDVLEPSFRINEKYQTFRFETGSGKVITGIVIEENSEIVKVIENPLAKAQPIVLKRGSITDRTKVNTSIMPKGLLDKLTREEILDLLAYVLAGGDQKNKLFQGGHEHHGH